MHQNRKTLGLGACALGLALAGLIPGQASASSSEEKRVAQLEDKLAASMALIEQLSARLEKIEGARLTLAPAAPVASSAHIDTQERIDNIERDVSRMADLAVNRRELGVPLHGFADLGYVHSSNDRNGRSGGFALGNLDVYLTPSLGERVKSIIELVFEYGPDNNALATDLERLQFGYTFSDALTVWAGRFHTPYGNWNTAFHHGQQIQTAASRPRFVEFEDKGGILPAHAVGMMATGTVRAGTGKLGYDAYVANGNRIADGVLDFNPYQDDNANKMVGANVRYAFGGALDGLTLGAHAMRQQVSEVGAVNEVLGTSSINMTGAYAVLDRDDWEVISEYYRFRNKDLSGATGTHASWAGFGQIGYTFANRFTPYARWEKASLDQSDRYFAAQESGRSYQRKVVGLRYALNPFTAIKFEFNHGTDILTDLIPFTYNEARLQFAIRF
jgi:hypothetical protein